MVGTPFETDRGCPCSLSSPRLSPWPVVFFFAESPPPATTMVNAPSQSSAVSTNHKGDVRNRAGIASYTAHWDKDSSKDTQEDTDRRKDTYTDVVNGYYDGKSSTLLYTFAKPHGYTTLPAGATELYEYGWGTSFHFCRYYKGEAFYQAIARHEHYLAAQTGIRPKMKVLDVGCGVGGPAREIARFTDAEVVGCNSECASENCCVAARDSRAEHALCSQTRAHPRFPSLNSSDNEFQVQRARKYTAKAGLSDQVTFVKGDFMHLVEQFGENSFDAV